jgi:hypothetical protein
MALHLTSKADGMQMPFKVAVRMWPEDPGQISLRRTAAANWRLDA